MKPSVKHLFSGTALLAAISMLTIVSADARPGDHLKKADLNGDGQITQNEFLQQARTMFVEADADANGQLTPGERRDHHKAKRSEEAEARFLSMDANGDGSVSLEEFQASRDARAEKFEEMREEFDGEGRGMRHEGRRGKRGDRGGRRGDLTDRFDTDEDGQISLAEHEAMAMAMFERMDANEDGVLSPEDREAHREHRRR